jgi:hypothetical protein
MLRVLVVVIVYSMPALLQAVAAVEATHTQQHQTVVQAAEEAEAPLQIRLLLPRRA